MKQAKDFASECASLERLLAALKPNEFERPTAFKSWTIEQILRHLHIWNQAALWSLTDEPRFAEYIKQAAEPIQTFGLPDFEKKFLEGLSGAALFDAWRSFYPRMAEAFSAVDPSQRVAWAGPSMSARSSVSARYMETWAHSQAIYDELGVDREENDAIEAIVRLGLNTYGWTFANRGMPVPQPRPALALVAPSGAVWELGDTAEGERIEGSAVEFCQVVAQTRNIADTRLRLCGANAASWMAIAQCFAGPANDPPAPGTRRKKARA